MIPIRLHPDNPHHLEFRGKPTLLISSGEHYGAVLNPDFDYITYLDELQRCGCNQTRAFAGTYVEIAGDFHIEHNTLAPAPGRFLCPWARSEAPGYAVGGNKFDLERWDEAYFARLRDYVAQAGERGVVVEVVLFCHFYDDPKWQASPMNGASNINGVGGVPRAAAYSLKNKRLLAVQEAVARQIVGALKEFDNVYYEIMNEPYIGSDGEDKLAWQRHMADVIAAVEADMAPPHLIAQNVQNRLKRVRDLHPCVSIMNFHYAWPEAVTDNYHLNRVIADDETGFAGQANAPYRHEAWEFILSGGGIFSHLDYSFTVEHPDGAAEIAGNTPGFGGREWRRQLKVLRDFIHGLDFLRLWPMNEIIGLAPASGRVRVLGERGKAYAIYLRGGGPRVSLPVTLPAGTYHAEWVDVLTGEVRHVEDVSHTAGSRAFLSPEYADDIALRIRATPTALACA